MTTASNRVETEIVDAAIKSKQPQIVLENQIFLDALSEMYDATREKGSVWVTIKRSKYIRGKY